jgi:hypothetical protein
MGRKSDEFKKLWRVHVDHFTYVLADDVDDAIHIAEEESLGMEETRSTAYLVQPDDVMDPEWADGSIPWGSTCDLPLEHYWPKHTEESLSNKIRDLAREQVVNVAEMRKLLKQLEDARGVKISPLVEDDE